MWGRNREGATDASARLFVRLFAARARLTVHLRSVISHSSVFGHREIVDYSCQRVKIIHILVTEVDKRYWTMFDQLYLHMEMFFFSPWEKTVCRLDRTWKWKIVNLYLYDSVIKTKSLFKNVTLLWILLCISVPQTALVDILKRKYAATWRVFG